MWPAQGSLLQHRAAGMGHPKRDRPQQGHPGTPGHAGQRHCSLRGAFSGSQAGKGRCAQPREAAPQVPALGASLLSHTQVHALAVARSFGCCHPLHTGVDSRRSTFGHLRSQFPCLDPVCHTAQASPGCLSRMGCKRVTSIHAATWGNSLKLKRAPRWWWQAQVPKGKPGPGRSCIAVRVVTGAVRQDRGPAWQGWREGDSGQGSLGE